MKDIIKMVDTLQTLATRKYDKQMLSFDWVSGEWYSRYHCKNLSTCEVCDWILEIHPWEE